MQLFTVLLLGQNSKLLEVEDLKVLADLVRKCETWALVDPLSKPGEELVDSGMPDVGPILDEWSTDKNFWIRRFSMLVLMRGLVRDEEYWDRFVRYADSMIEKRSAGLSVKYQKYDRSRLPIMCVAICRSFQA